MTIYVVVKLTLPDTAGPAQVVQEMDYSFSLVEDTNEVIQETEIVDWSYSKPEPCLFEDEENV